MRVERAPEPEQEQINPYEVLGIRKWASENEVKRAYFSLVKKFSPELYPEKFVQIRQAYDSLRRPNERAKIDILLYNEMAGNIGFKNLKGKTESVVKLNKAIKDIESSGHSQDQKKELIRLLQERSMVYVNKNYWQEAIADWERILELSPGNREARRNLSLAYARLGYSYAQSDKLDKAIDAWKKVLRYQPGNIEATHNIAIASSRLRRLDEEAYYWEKTLETWGRMIERDDKNEYVKNLIVETHKHFGGRFIGKEKKRETVQPVAQPEKKEVETRPAGQKALQQIEGFQENKRLGTACLSSGNWTQAIQCFEKCLEEKPENIEVLNSLGKAYLNSGNMNKAFALWNRALKLSPGNRSTRDCLLQGHLSVGNSLRSQGAFGPALVHFKKVLNLVPDRPEILMEVGNTYAMKDDYASAVEHWEKALELDPGNKVAKQAIQQAKAKIHS